MKLRIPAMLAAMLALSLLAVGCTGAPGAATPDPLHTEEYPKIAATEYLHRSVVFDSPVVDPGDEAKPMQVSVPVRSTARREINTQYRFIFFNEDGMPLRDQSDWRFTQMGRTQQHLVGRATDSAAADWRLEIRPAR